MYCRDEDDDDASKVEEDKEEDSDCNNNNNSDDMMRMLLLLHENSMLHALCVQHSTVHAQFCILRTVRCMFKVTWCMPCASYMPAVYFILNLISYMLCIVSHV